MEHALFFLGIFFIIVHELDAIRCREWRIFPGLSSLNHRTGKWVFILAHIPLFFLLLYVLTVHSENLRFIRGLEIFLILHAVLHVLFLTHKNNEFKDWFSWMLIIGAGLFGLADLILHARGISIP